MPAALTYPGVYIEELQSGVRTITGVPTSITAFIGSALRGPTDDPVRVQSFADFERQFGGLSAQSTLGYAVAQFFLNGGGDALVVRVAANGAKAKVTIGGLPLIAAQSGAAGNNIAVTVGNATSGTPTLFKLTVDDGVNPAVNFDEQSNTTIAAALAAAAVRVDPDGPALNARPTNAGPTHLAGGKDAATAATGALDGFTLAAASVGLWGQGLRFRVDNVGGGKFNLSVGDSGSGATERFLNLSADPNDPRFVTTVLEQQSSLVRTQGAVPNPLTKFSDPPAKGVDPLLDDTTLTKLTGDPTADGAPISDNDISLASLQDPKHGLWALEKADLFNLLCIPPLAFDTDINATTRTAAAQYCKERRALFIVDPLMAWNRAANVIGDPSQPATGIDGTDFGLARSENAALFFPFVLSPDPLQENRLETFAPCGAVAGVMARTDTDRGVWKAPAGIDATLAGASAAVDQADRRRERAAQSDRHQLSARVSGRRTRGLGRAHAPGRRSARVAMEIHSGAPARALHRGKPVPRHPMGRVRAERRAALGADPAQCRRVHEHAVPAGRLPGRRAEGRLLRQVQQRDDDADRHRQRDRQHHRRFRSAQACRIRRHQDPADRWTDPSVRRSPWLSSASTRSALTPTRTSSFG